MIEHQTRGKRRSRAKDAADRKRAVYVEQACVTCKSRKTRCDGTHPVNLVDVVPLTVDTCGILSTLISKWTTRRGVLVPAPLSQGTR